MKDWLLYAMVTFVLWGIYAFLPKIAVQHIPQQAVLMVQMLGGFVSGAVALAIMGFRWEFHWVGSSLAFATGVCGIIGALFYNLAMKEGSAVTVATVTALYPLIAILLSFIFTSDPFTWKHAAGTVCAVAAIVFFSL